MFVIKCVYCDYWGTQITKALCVRGTEEEAEETCKTLTEADSEESNRYEFESISSDVDPSMLPESSLIRYKHDLPRYLEYIFHDIYDQAIREKAKANGHAGSHNEINRIRKLESLVHKMWCVRRYIADIGKDTTREPNVGKMNQIYTQSEIMNMLYPLLVKRHEKEKALLSAWNPVECS